MEKLCSLLTPLSRRDSLQQCCWGQCFIFVLRGKHLNFDLFLFCSHKWGKTPQVSDGCQQTSSSYVVYCLNTGTEKTSVSQVTSLLYVYMNRKFIWIWFCEIYKSTASLKQFLKTGREKKRSNSSSVLFSFPGIRCAEQMNISQIYMQQSIEQRTVDF